jgi:hypothetical protein
MTITSRWHGLDLFGLELRFSPAGRGSGFAGAAWRGLMGQSLFRAACSYPAPACGNCPAAGSCAYPGLFKPLAEAALPPFWLHGWQHRQDGWRVQVRWLGDRRFALGEWLAGLGNGNPDQIYDGVPVRLECAATVGTGKAAWRRDAGWLAPPAALPLTPPAPQEVCRVRFVTPLVSKHSGDPLFGALHTRLQRLVRQHGDGTVLPRPDSPWHCRVIAQKTRHVPLARRALSGTEWDLELSQIAPAAWESLWAGAELHAGGQTGMGCGCYEILPAAKEDAARFHAGATAPVPFPGDQHP